MHKLVDPTDGYVGALIEQAAKMETTSARYEALAADPQVTAALAKVNEKAWPKVKLGPSPAFATEFPPVRKLRSAYNTEVVKFTLEGGVPHVSVMLNGLVSTPMVFDSGASIVLLPYDIATRAGLSPGRGERKIPLTIANGKSVEATVMTLDSVRVGQFTVQNVECAVLPKSSGSAEGLLGGTFLRHFSTRLDLGAHELHLSQVDAPADGRKTPASKPTAKPATQPAR
jgi:clan AA aspartic protease (TIGR02281 family)